MGEHTVRQICREHCSVEFHNELFDVASLPCSLLRSKAVSLSNDYPIGFNSGMYRWL